MDIISGHMLPRLRRLTMDWITAGLQNGRPSQKTSTLIGKDSPLLTRTMHIIQRLNSLSRRPVTFQTPLLLFSFLFSAEDFAVLCISVLLENSVDFLLCMFFQKSQLSSFNFRLLIPTRYLNYSVQLKLKY